MTLADAPAIAELLLASDIAVLGRSDYTLTEVDAYVHPDHDAALGDEVLATLEARGLELATEAGHDHAFFDTAAYRQDERTRGWLADRGYEIATTFTRMRTDLPGPVIPPGPPAGVVVRRSDANEDDLRTAHDIHEKAFTEHYGSAPRSFEKFRDQFTEHGPDWSSLWLGDVDGTASGLLIGTQQFVEEDNAGYVRIVGGRVRR